MINNVLFKPFGNIQGFFIGLWFFGLDFDSCHLNDRLNNVPKWWIIRHKCQKQTHQPRKYTFK